MEQYSSKARKLHEELVKRSERVPPMGRWKLAQLWNASKAMLKQAEAHRKGGEFLAEYEILMRYSHLMVKVKDHKDFGKMTPGQLKYRSEFLGVIVDRLVKMKPDVMEKLEEIAARPPPPRPPSVDLSDKGKGKASEEDEKPLDLKFIGKGSSSSDLTSPSSAGGAFQGGFGGGALRRVIVYGEIMDAFLSRAQSNTSRGIETAGVLCGPATTGAIQVTHVIIPKQIGTPNTCETTNEEDLFMAMEKYDLIMAGWIHTHPTQTCFMSSVDVHTQSSYQAMLPESIAIVMAPKYSPNHGVFSLTEGGLDRVMACSQRGFHEHPGGPCYTTARHADIQWGTGKRVEFIDLR